MAATILFLAVLVLLGYAVQRHHQRFSGLAGSATVTDRDAERMRVELNAADAQQYRGSHGRAHAGGSATREVGVPAGR
ncbi:MAG TPA: hypothetical protein VH333_08965 [Pseudonocardiaceae bacterium]|jgi:hypothetical protein|nr:hypothetical protein [Pseudonocardiaceae bacterium]